MYTYLASLGRAVVKGSNILYLVGYSLVLWEAFCPSTDSNQLVRVEWLFVLSLSSKMQWAKPFWETISSLPHEQKVMDAVLNQRGNGDRKISGWGIIGLESVKEIILAWKLDFLLCCAFLS